MPAPRLKKVVDEVFAISARRGNGKVRVETWVDKAGKVVRYNIAYINHSLFAGDNGRVLGYDSQHDYHHRHYLGTVARIAFESFEEIELLFESELHQLLKRGSL
ncbi:MAG: transcriptional regulator [Betaproteobacteria bacterium]|nr:transcriptional regulator [Betaproteobacteria bacterium]